MGSPPRCAAHPWPCGGAGTLGFKGARTGGLDGRVVVLFFSPPPLLVSGARPRSTSDELTLGGLGNTRSNGNIRDFPRAAIARPAFRVWERHGGRHSLRRAAAAKIRARARTGRSHISSRTPQMSRRPHPYIVLLLGSPQAPPPPPLTTTHHP